MVQIKMDIIQLKRKNGVEQYAPRTTEMAMYPDIDNNYTIIAYKGRRIVLRDEQVCGFCRLPNLPNSNMQGMAIYNNIMVRMSTGTTHYIYNISGNGSVSQIATFSANTNHSNSLQFAPTLESGQSYPYLYVSELPDACTVLEISSTYAVTTVQRITIQSGVVEGGNLQIGSDGYIWYSGCVGANNASRWRFIKFRKVYVSEGASIVLTDNDIIDDWITTEIRPYNVYAFQGFIIKFGMIFQLYGYGAGTNYKRGFAVYNTATHAMITEIDLTDKFTDEPEDLDVWDDSIVLCTNATSFFQLKF